MSRVLVRRASVMIVIAALALAALPPAYARPLAGPQATAPGGVSWISALATWVSSFFITTTTKAPTAHTSAASSTSGSYSIQPMTGTCIDPNGRIVPCNSI